jgi:hypothetical protein
MEWSSLKILKTCWLQAPYAFSTWRFEFKSSFLFRNDGEWKFLRKVQRFSRKWLKKKYSQPMPLLPPQQ